MEALRFLFGGLATMYKPQNRYFMPSSEVT